MQLEILKFQCHMEVSSKKPKASVFSHVHQSKIDQIEKITFPATMAGKQPSHGRMSYALSQQLLCEEIDLAIENRSQVGHTVLDGSEIADSNHLVKAMFSEFLFI